MPATWKQYGVDANDDGTQGPVQPGRRDLRRRALPEGRRRRAGHPQARLRLQPRRLVRRLGAHARAADRRPARRPRRLAHRPDRRATSRSPPRRRYADDISPTQGRQEGQEGQRRQSRSRRARRRTGINIFAEGRLAGHRRPGRPDRQDRQRRRASASFIQLHDAYGNTYTYGHLTKLAQHVPGAEAADASPQSQVAKELTLPKPTRSRRARAGAGEARAGAARRRTRRPASPRRDAAAPAAAAAVAKERLFANPTRPTRVRAPAASDAAASTAAPRSPAARRSSPTSPSVYGLEPRRRRPQATSRSARKVIAGTILGRIGKTVDTDAPHVLFEIRPAGTRRPAHRPEADPRRLEAARVDGDLPRAGQEPVLRRRRRRTPSIGQILLMSKETLADARPRRPAHRDLHLRPPRHRGRRRSTAACSRRSSSSPPAA